MAKLFCGIIGLAFAYGAYTLVFTNWMYALGCLVLSLAFFLAAL